MTEEEMHRYVVDIRESLSDTAAMMHIRDFKEELIKSIRADHELEMHAKFLFEQLDSTYNWESMVDDDAKARYKLAVVAIRDTPETLGELAFVITHPKLFFSDLQSYAKACWQSAAIQLKARLQGRKDAVQSPEPVW